MKEITKNRAPNMRFDYIDNVRGLAMLVIISWHVLNIHSPWTDTWTMPVFFVIMGFFYKKTDWKTLAQKKTATLIVPWLFFSIPDFVLKLINHGWLFVMKEIFNPYKYIHAGSWFVVCTLWIYILAYILHRINNSHLRLICTWLMITIGFILSYTHIQGYRVVLPLNSHSAMCMFVFFEIGYLVKDVILHSSIKKMIWILAVGMILYMIDITILGGVKPFDIIWVSWNQNVILMMIRCMIGCGTILALCRLLPKLPLVAYLGRYSLIVLLAHFYVINIFKMYVEQPWMIYFATIIATWLLTMICVKFIPKCVGVNKK